MKAESDLSTMQSHSTPYAAKLMMPVSRRLSEDVVDYFKDLAKDADVPYQSLINLYLRYCVMKHRKVQITWPSSTALPFVQAETSVGRGSAPDRSCPHHDDAPDLRGPLLPLHAPHTTPHPTPRTPHAPPPPNN